MKKVFAILASAILSIGIGTAGAVGDISVKKLNMAIEAGNVTVIDVNGSASYKSGHVPTAIDFQSKKNELAELLPADKGALVVAYCSGPSCGAYAQAAKAAKDLGYTNVKHLSAGISGWKAAGMTLAKAMNKEEMMKKEEMEKKKMEAEKAK